MKTNVPFPFIPFVCIAMFLVGIIKIILGVASGQWSAATNGVIVLVMAQVLTLIYNDLKRIKERLSMK